MVRLSRPWPPFSARSTSPSLECEGKERFSGEIPERVAQATRVRIIESVRALESEFPVALFFHVSWSSLEVKGERSECTSQMGTEVERVALLIEAVRKCGDRELCR